MSYLPCKNTACKSYGKPHQNCRCYAEMAHGGEIGFCSGDRAHDPGCEYFFAGGDTLPEGFEFESAPTSTQNGLPEGFEFEAPRTGNSLPDGFAFEGEPEKPATYGDAVKQAAEREFGKVEAVAKGFAGPVATGSELLLSKLGVPGLSAEDIKRRESEHPIEHGLYEAAGTGLSFATPIGPAKLLVRGLEAIPAIAKFAKVSKVGADMVKGFLTNGIIGAGDEASKWALGQGDPNDPVAARLAHIGFNGLVGMVPGATGYFGSMGKKKLMALAEQKMGDKIASATAGIGAMASGESVEAEQALKGALKEIPFDRSAFRRGIPQEVGQSFDESAYETGKKLYKYALNKIASGTGAVGGAIKGGMEGGIPGLVTGAAEGYMKALPANIIGKWAAKKWGLPVTLKILSGGTTKGILDVLNHADETARGYDKIANAVESAYRGVTTSAISSYGSEKNREKTANYIENGGITQDIQQENYEQNMPDEIPEFAEGGEVHKPKPMKTSPLLKEHDGVAMHYPEQNVLLNMAKGRISNYLNSLRPQPNQPKLAFDDEPDQREQKKSYHRALDIANHPLGVLEELRKGTLEAEHVKHFNALYPEVNGLLQKKLTERIIKDQLAGKKPPYKIRQGLSMLMGTALSSELTPQNIQAAQAVFMQKNSQQQQGPEPTKTKKSSNSLSKSDSAFLTGSQALAKRQQRS